MKEGNFFFHPSVFIFHTCQLEREERFELSKRVWKTRMFPATSLPQDIADFRLEMFGTPGRARTCNLDVRSVALFQIELQEQNDCGLRIAECGLFKSETRNPETRTPQSEIRNPHSAWSGRTELNCRHEFPGLGCSRYTTPRKMVSSFGFEVSSCRGTFKLFGVPNSEPRTRNSKLFSP